MHARSTKHFVDLALRLQVRRGEEKCTSIRSNCHHVCSDGAAHDRVTARVAPHPQKKQNHTRGAAKGSDHQRQRSQYTAHRSRLYACANVLVDTKGPTPLGVCSEKPSHESPGRG